MTRNILLVAATLLLTSLYACGRSGTTSDTVKVGVIAFLTGPQASLGTEVKNALDLELIEINKMGGVDGKPLELIYEDSQDKPAQAILAFNKLKGEGVPAIITTGDVVSLSLAPLADSNQLPVVCTVAAGPDIIKDKKWIYRCFIRANDQASEIANFAGKKLHLKTASLLTINNEFGVATDNTFKKVFAENGGRVLKAETFSVSDTDVRSQLNRLLQDKPDAVFVSGFGPAYAAAIRQLRELKYPGHILTVSTLSIPYFMQQTKPANEGVFYPAAAFDADGKNEQAAKFIRDYTEKYKAEPSFIAAFAADSLALLAQAMKSQASPEGIRSNLAKIERDGLAGKLAFDHNGEVEYELAVKTVHDGKAVDALAVAPAKTVEAAQSKSQ